MDLLLTHGYFISEDAHEQKIIKPYPPLGILSISAYLKARGFDVQVFDTTFSTRVEFVAQIERARPRIVGIYCNLMTKFNVLEMIAQSKRIGAGVVLGGPEPASYAEEYLAHGADVIVIGEGELTLEELVPALAKNGAHHLAHIAGIVYWDEHGALVRTAPRAQIKNLDALPFPDRAAIDVRQYVDTWRTHHGRGSLSLICARGCPYHCTWCSHAVYGETHRRRSPENVVAEVEQLLASYHPDQLWYADDVFTIHPGWLTQYARRLTERGIRIPFECITRADRLDAVTMDTLATMGCYRVWIGSESGSQKILDAMRREVRVEQVQWATHELQQRGIEVGMFFMLGFEGETESDLAATSAHLKKSNPDIFLTTIAYPIKGTPYYQQVNDRIIARAGWTHRTDRQLGVRGRHSRRYYEFAQRWMAGEFNLRRSQNKATRLIRSVANIGIGKLGMALTAREREA